MARERSGLIRQFQTVQDVENSDLLVLSIQWRIGLRTDSIDDACRAVTLFVRIFVTIEVN